MEEENLNLENCINFYKIVNKVDNIQKESKNDLFKNEEKSEIRLKQLLKISVGFNNSFDPWGKNNTKIDPFTG